MAFWKIKPRKIEPGTITPRRINFWWITSATLVVGLGITAFLFVPRLINQRRVETIRPSAARDLKGVWQGSVTTVYQDPLQRCTYSGQLTVEITNQNGNDITGTAVWQLATKTQEAFSEIGASCGAYVYPDNGTYEFVGNVRGSSISFTDNGGTYSGSFTSDTMTLNWTYAGGGFVQPATLKLLKTK